MAIISLSSSSSTSASDKSYVRQEHDAIPEQSPSIDSFIIAICCLNESSAKSEINTIKEQRLLRNNKHQQNFPPLTGPNPEVTNFIARERISIVSRSTYF